MRFLHDPRFPSDLDQLWYAARALAHGYSPYDAVGPGRPFNWAWPVFYPLPAILLAIPFSLVPVGSARILFSVVSGGTLGYALGPRWRVLWPLFLSESYYLAIARNQWSPLILACFWLPMLGFVVAAKPNVGFEALAAQNRHNAARVVLLSLALVAASFLVRPMWLQEWLTVVRHAPNKEVAVLQPGGFLLLAALFRWRSPDGRVLLTASVVPQTPGLYDALQLFALCKTLRQALVLSALTHATQGVVIALGPYATFDAYYASLERLTVWLVLVPCLLFLFRNRRYTSLTERGLLGGEPQAETALAARLTNYTLIGFIVVALGVQVWIILRP
jgi:hypothetical protein